MPGDKWLPISWDHWFGTDGAGKDLFSQVLAGARTTLFVVAGDGGAGRGIGLVLGVFSALAPRVVGESFAHLIDVLIAMPTLILALVFVASLGGSVWTVSLALGVALRRRARPGRAGRDRAGADPGLHRHRHRVGLVDVAHGVAPHRAEHRDRRDRPTVDDRRAHRARRGRTELPRADPVSTPSWGRMLETLQQIDDRAPAAPSCSPGSPSCWRRSASTCSATGCATPSTRACGTGGDGVTGVHDVVDQVDDPPTVHGGRRGGRVMALLDVARVERRARRAPVVDDVSFEIAAGGRLGSSASRGPARRCRRWRSSGSCRTGATVERQHPVRRSRSSSGVTDRGLHRRCAASRSRWCSRARGHRSTR